MSSRRPGKNKNWKFIGWVIITCALVFTTLFEGINPFRKQKKSDIDWSYGSFLSVSGKQTDYREGLVYLVAKVAEYNEQYGKDIWSFKIDESSQTVFDVIKESVLEQIIYIKVVTDKADELGVALTADEIREVDEYTKKFCEAPAYSTYESMGINKDIVRRVFTDQALAKKVYEKETLMTDSDISDEEAKQVTVNAIAVKNYKIGVDGSRKELEPGEKEAIRAHMEDILGEACKAKNFSDYAKTVTENDKLLTISVGRGDFEKKVEDYIFSLKTGEISAVLETDDYFYIFYCVSEFDREATQKKKEEIIATKRKKAFINKYKRWRTEKEVVVNEEVWGKLVIG